MFLLASELGFNGNERDHLISVQLSLIVNFGLPDKLLHPSSTKGPGGDDSSLKDINNIAQVKPLEIILYPLNKLSFLS
jgi:hypothetical protein